MDTRVAVISIIVEQEDAIEELNTLLHAGNGSVPQSRQDSPQ